MEKGCISGSSVMGAAFIGKYLSRYIKGKMGLHTKKNVHLQITCADIDFSTQEDSLAFRP